MATNDKKVIDEVYKKFVSNERDTWTDLDDSMYFMEDLKDEQLFREACVLYHKHQNGKPRSSDPHPGKESFIPTILKAIDIVLKDYDKNKSFSTKNKYILQYYLSLDSIGMIVYT